MLSAALPELGSGTALAVTVAYLINHARESEPARAMGVHFPSAGQLICKQALKRASEASLCVRLSVWEVKLGKGP